MGEESVRDGYGGRVLLVFGKRRLNWGIGDGRCCVIGQWCLCFRAGYSREAMFQPTLGSHVILPLCGLLQQLAVYSIMLIDAD